MILRGPIHTMLPKFFMEEPTESGGGADTNTITEGDPPPYVSPSAMPDIERAEGERPPDFSSLIGKPKGEPKGEPKEPEPPKESPKEPEKAETPKGQPKGKETAPEPAKPAAETKAEPKKAESAKEKAEPAKPKEEVAKPKAELPDNDDDLEKIRSQPGASTAVVASINGMKGLVKESRQIARTAREELKAAQTELETLRANAGKLPPELEEEVNRAREYRMAVEAESNPTFQKEFVEPITKSDEALFAWMKERDASDDLIETIKKTGVEKYDWTGVFEALKTSPLASRRLEDMIIGREKMVQAKEGKLADLAKNKDGFIQELNEREQTTRTEWAKEVETHAIKECSSRDWLLMREVPRDATPEQKKAIEEDNEVIKGHAKAINTNLRAAYERDPVLTTQIAIKAVEADRLKTENEELVKKHTGQAARIEELETRLARYKDAGRTAHEATPAPPKIPPAQPEKVGGDTRSAIDAYFSKK